MGKQRAKTGHNDSPPEVENKAEVLAAGNVQDMNVPNEDALPENVDVPIVEEVLNLATIRDELNNQKENIIKLGSMMTELAENIDLSKEHTKNLTETVQTLITRLQTRGSHNTMVPASHLK